MKDKLYNIGTDIEGKTIKTVTARPDDAGSFFQIELIFTDNTLVKVCDGGMRNQGNSLMYSGLHHLDTTSCLSTEMEIFDERLHRLWK